MQKRDKENLSARRVGFQPCDRLLALGGMPSGVLTMQYITGQK